MKLPPFIPSAAVIATVVLTSGWLTARFTFGDRTIFAPQSSTAGHYQIESRCDLCHTPFGGVSSSKCLKCHDSELKLANDSHAAGKFADPRNAHTLSMLDASECRTCHHEHRPADTLAGGVTQPAEHCFACHTDIATQRPSHAKFDKRGCSATGCHKYHDNTALYEDFITRHLSEEETVPNARIPARSAPKSLPLTAADSGTNLALGAEIIGEWRSTAHGGAGVNCSGCHSTATETGRKWFTGVTVEQCASCHEHQARGFLEARHGMRLAQELPAMSPGAARQPMKMSAGHREMTCNACHTGHRFDTRTAAVEACLNCHDDQHSLAFGTSKHFKLWQTELSGQGAAGSGVSCATCHLPREEITREGEAMVAVQHNANANLRPNEKMLRGVCLKCHGYEFSVSALADVKLLQNNFAGRPSVKNESVEMVARRLITNQNTNAMKE